MHLFNKKLLYRAIQQLLYGSYYTAAVIWQLLYVIVIQRPNLTSSDVLVSYNLKKGFT